MPTSARTHLPRAQGLPFLYIGYASEFSGNVPVKKGANRIDEEQSWKHFDLYWRRSL